MTLSGLAGVCYMYSQGIAIFLTLLWLCCCVFGENDKVSFKEILMKPSGNVMIHLPDKNWFSCMLECHVRTGCKAFLFQKTMTCTLYHSTDTWTNVEPGERVAMVTGYTADLLDTLVPAKAHTSCSSSTHHSGFSCHRANDGNMSTSFKPSKVGVENNGEWVQFDFDQNERVIAVDMYQVPMFKAQCQLMTFTFRDTAISVESAYVDTDEPLSFDRFLFPHVTTDTLRITCHSGVLYYNNWVIYELIIYAIPQQ